MDLKMKRAQSEPIDLKKTQEGAQTREGQPADSSGLSNARPQGPTQSSNRQVLLKKSNQMSDEDDNQNQDKKTSSSFKTDRPRQQSASSSKPPQGSLGTPKRTRQARSNEDCHQAKKPNISPFEPRDDSAPVWSLDDEETDNVADKDKEKKPEPLPKKAQDDESWESCSHGKPPSPVPTVQKQFYNPILDHLRQQRLQGRSLNLAHR